MKYIETTIDPGYRLKYISVKSTTAFDWTFITDVITVVTNASTWQ